VVAAAAVGCLALTQRRASQERGVDIEYLKALHARHEAWLCDKTVVPEFTAPVLIIDADDEFETSPAKQADMITKVRDFVAQLRRADRSAAHTSI
jgi:hypothetical protein